MSRRSLLLGAGLAVAAVGAAVGVVLAFTGGGSTLTPAEYLARADAACLPFARRLDRVPPPDLSSPADVARRVSAALPLLQRQADAVRKLHPPRALEPRVRRFFTLTDRSLAALDSALAAARRNDAKAMGSRLGTWLRTSTAAQAASKRVGYHC